MNPALLALLARVWQPLVALVAVACITLAVHGYGNHRYAMGRDDVKAEDAAAATILRARIAELEAASREAAIAAHATYEVEHAQNVFAARQPLAASQLCSPEDTSGGRVPEAGRAQPGDAASAATASVVQPMPASDPGRAANRLRLLRALGGMADDQPAVIREFQAREAARERRSTLP